MTTMTQGGQARKGKDHPWGGNIHSLTNNHHKRLRITTAHLSIAYLIRAKIYIPDPRDFAWVLIRPSFPRKKSPFAAPRKVTLPKWY